jgi:uncharacterized membrane protein/predicted secreted protein
MDQIVLYLVIVFAAGFGIVYLGMRRETKRGSDLPAGTERAPWTPIQRRAMLSLAIGALASGCAVIVFLAVGPEKALEESTVRRLVLGLALVGLLAPAVFDILARSLWRRPGSRVVIDERDERILQQAPRTQVVAIIVSMVIWLVILNEAFREAGWIPVMFLTLIFWSCLLVAMLALPLGVLLGYRRE